MSKPKPLPDLDVLLTWFRVDLTSPSGLRHVGKRRGRLGGSVAGRQKNPDARWRVRFEGKIYLVHRIVWKLTYGEDPPGFLDHKDLHPSNNDPENLRPATDEQNQWNRGPSIRNNTGVRGVQYSNRARKFRAGITCSGRRIHIGYYDNLADATAAVEVAIRENYGDYGRVA